jgi:hypothetical protein
MKRLLVLLFCAAMAFGQDESTAEKPEAQTVDYSTRSGFGFCGGATSGIGFAYRRHFQSRWGVHIGAFGLGGSEKNAYYYGDGKEHTRSWTWLDIGAQAMYTLHRHPSKYFRFYALAGGEALLYGETPVDVYNPSSGTSTVNEGEWDLQPTYLVGAGFGFEFLFARHIGLSLELPLSALINESGFNMYPIGNMALIYFF